MVFTTEKRVAVNFVNSREQKISEKCICMKGKIAIFSTYNYDILCLKKAKW